MRLRRAIAAAAVAAKVALVLLAPGGVPIWVAYRLARWWFKKGRVGR